MILTEVFSRVTEAMSGLPGTSAAMTERTVLKSPMSYMLIALTLNRYVAPPASPVTLNVLTRSSMSKMFVVPVALSQKS